jgi:hypothetical protein
MMYEFLSKDNIDIQSILTTPLFGTQNYSIRHTIFVNQLCCEYSANIFSKFGRTR